MSFWRCVAYFASVWLGVVELASVIWAARDATS